MHVPPCSPESSSWPSFPLKTVNADHVTVIGNGEPGSVGVLAASTTSTVQQFSEVNLSNAIVRGFGTALHITASNSGAPLGASNASINTTYSNFDNHTADVGPGGTGSVNIGAGRLAVDPLFVNAAGGDFRLQAGSPLVDAGDPVSEGAATDLDGESRVSDGDGDGTARRDMGAYEYLRPAPPADTTAPGTTITKKPAKRTTKAKVRFRFTSTEAGSTFHCKRDKKAYKPCSSPLAWKVKLGKHVLRVRAVDAAGNVDGTPARYRFKRVPRT